MESRPPTTETDEPTRLEGDALEACLALQPVATILACRRVSSVWRAAALGVLSSSEWQAGVPLLVLLDHGAPAAAVRARLRAAPSDLCVEGKGGRSPLHHALARRVRGETVLALLAADAKAARTMGQGKMLALHVAASAGAGADVVLSLVAAHPGAARERAKGSKLPVHFAAALHSVPLAALEALLDAHPAGITARAHDGCLPLHLAVASSKASTIVVELLLRRGAAGAREPGRNGMLPLHMAAEHGAPSAVVRALLREYAAGARVVDRSGSLPLHLAIAAGAPAVVTKLVRSPLSLLCFSLCRPVQADGGWRAVCYDAPTSERGKRVERGEASSLAVRLTGSTTPPPPCSS